jgi:hypothetical protein
LAALFHRPNPTLVETSSSSPPAKPVEPQVTPRGDVTIDPRRQQLIGVRTVAATRTSLTPTIRAVGSVRAAETRLADVNVKLDGWIRDLYVDYTGQAITKGQPLFRLYSPDLLATENEYVLALKTRDQLQQSQIAEARARADQLVVSARQRLALWDLPEEEQRALDEERRPHEAVTFRSPAGAQVPLGQLAEITLSRGPAMVRDENGQLVGYVYIDTATSDIGGYVDQAKRAIAEHVTLPSGYTLQWTGQYEFLVRARERFKVLIPLVVFIIFMMLYLMFHSVSEAAIVMLSVVYAMTGGVMLQWLLGYNFSVAVWVGYIALYGVAVQTGVVMVLYLHEALDKRLRQGGTVTERDIREATIAGSVLRLRPKLMTVCVVMAGLVPILWSTGVGSDIMKPIAAPIIGGMVTSTIHVLIITPVIFYILKLRALRKGTLKLSDGVPRAAGADSVA